MWAFLIFIIILALSGIFYYNQLVYSHQQVQEAKASIATVLKQRFDLIPNLVETVKGYAKHEKEIFEKVAELRSQWQRVDISKLPVDKLADIAAASSNLLKTLIAVAENYPDLKASANFLDLQDELSHIEEKLERARRYYNATVREYNTQIMSFPSVIVAKLFGFTPQRYFEVSQQEAEPPKVKF